MGFLDAPHRATAAVTAQVQAQVPPLVSQALASDPSVSSSAANMAQSTAGLVPVWKASTSYTAGQRVIAPNGDVVAAKATFTSGASFSAANWNASTQDGRIGAVESLAATAVQPWKASTAYIAGARVVAPGGDIVTAKVAFTSAATYDPANWTASGQDGRIGTIEKTAVFNGDQRLMNLETLDDVSFSVADSEDRRLWLEAGKDGKPTSYASGLIGDTLGFQTAPLDGGNGFAVVDAQDRIVFAPNKAHPSLDWAHWGDSMTDNAVTGVDAWVNQLSALTGRNHFNGGWYQQTSVQIAARQGGLPALVTVTNNATAASGGTVVTSIINSPVLYSSTRYVRGTLAGISGSLQQPFTNQVMFYPDDPGVFPIPPKSMFIPANALANRDRHLTIWTGRNDVYSTDPQLVVAAIQQMIDYVSSDVKRVLVFEVPPSTADGTNGKPLTKAINDAIKAAFPAYWLPIASWLRTTDAATAAGITFTDQDNIDIANGDTPTSFRLDSVHINAAGCKAVAYRVNQEAQKRGWL